MSELIRDSNCGQLIRFLTRNRFLQYAEEKSDFQCPPRYLITKPPSLGSHSPDQASSGDNRASLVETEPECLASGSVNGATQHESVSPARQTPSTRSSESLPGSVNPTTTLEQTHNSASVFASNEKEEEHTLPTSIADRKILVDWYGADDPENPQNWSLGRKSLVVCLIYVYGLAVYMGSAIVTPALPYLVEQMDLSLNVAGLSLSMYVFGYGFGPLLFSPLSEIPVIGRNVPYIVSFGVFVILSVPTATVNNFPGLVVLRFLQGFMGSPCLATGGATLGDIFTVMKLPYFLAGWAGFATTGPALGPIISGFSIPATNWHWSMWEILWFAAPVFVAMFLFLPETSPSTILLRRAQRLRTLTGNANLMSQSEIDQHHLNFHDVVIDSLWRPTQINIQDPAIMFTSLYTGLLYGAFYSFFEVFPLVYAGGNPGTETHGYGMNAGEIGLIFLSNVVGVGTGVVIYTIYLYCYFEPELRSKGLSAPERCLLPAVFASFLYPTGLFIFAWTGNNSPKIHWIVPTIGVVISTVGSYILFQCLLFYMPLTYPQYAASLFAGNDFARSSTAAAAIHFSHPLFHNLGVGRGVSLLGGLCVGGVIGMFILYYFGAALRARSRFAVK